MGTGRKIFVLSCQTVNWKHSDPDTAKTLDALERIHNDRMGVLAETGVNPNGMAYGRLDTANSTMRAVVAAGIKALGYELI